MAIKFDSIPLVGGRSLLPRRYQNGLAVISEFDSDQTLHIPIGGDISPGYNAVGTFYVITNSGNPTTKPNLNIARFSGKIFDSATGNVVDSIALSYGSSIIIGVEDQGQVNATVLAFGSDGGAGGTYVLPVATEQVLGGVKSGNGFSTDASGKAIIAGTLGRHTDFATDMTLQPGMTNCFPTANVEITLVKLDIASGFRQGDIWTVINASTQFDITVKGVLDIRTEQVTDLVITAGMVAAFGYGDSYAMPFILFYPMNNGPVATPTALGLVKSGADIDVSQDGAVTVLTAKSVDPKADISVNTLSAASTVYSMKNFVIGDKNSGGAPTLSATAVNFKSALATFKRLLLVSDDNTNIGMNSANPPLGAIYIDNTTEQKSTVLTIDSVALNNDKAKTAGLITSNSVTIGPAGAPSFTVTESGDISAAATYTPATDKSLATKEYVDTASHKIATAQAVGVVKATSEIKVDTDGSMSVGVIPHLNVNSTATNGKVWLSKYNGGSGHSDAPKYGTPEAQYLQIGGYEYGLDSVRGIGFGYAYSSTGVVDSISPAFIGYQEKKTTGDTYGDLIFCTRDTTTKGDVPAPRLTITSTGDLVVNSLYVPATDYSLVTRKFVTDRFISNSVSINPSAPTPGSATVSGNYIFNNNATNFNMTIGIPVSDVILSISNKSTSDVTLTSSGTARFSADGSAVTTTFIVKPGEYKLFRKSVNTWYVMN